MEIYAELFVVLFVVFSGNGWCKLSFALVHFALMHWA